MSHREFSWKSAKNINLFGQVWQPEGQTQGVIVLIPGLGEHGGRYTHVAEFFNNAGLAVISFDTPGHGRSEGKRGHSSYDEIVKEIDHLLEETRRLFPDKPVFLYGHSLGAALCLYYCMKRKPEINGVIAGAPGLVPVQDTRRKEQLANILIRFYPSFLLENGLDQAGLSRDEDVVRRYQEDPLVHNKISIRLGLDLIQIGRWLMEHSAEWPDIPLLLMQGTEDRLVSPQSTARFARSLNHRVTYKEWEGFYHELHNEPEKEQVLNYMLGWVESHLK